MAFQQGFMQTVRKSWSIFSTAMYFMIEKIPLHITGLSAIAGMVMGTFYFYIATGGNDSDLQDNRQAAIKYFTWTGWCTLLLLIGILSNVRKLLSLQNGQMNPSTTSIKDPLLAELGGKLDHLTHEIEHHFAPRRFPNVEAAENDIKESIVSAIERNKNNRSQTRLQVRIIGTTLDSIQRMLAELIKKHPTICLQVEFSVYHIDPDTMLGWPAKETFQQDGTLDTWEHEAQGLKARIKKLNDTAVEYKVKVKPYEYRHAPSFYAWIIGDDSIFWGPCIWNKDKSKFEGGCENFCWYIQRSHPFFKDFSRWLQNRCDLYEAWAEKDELHSLGYSGGLKKKADLVTILSTLPPTTTSIRTLFLSGRTCMSNDNVVRRLKSLQTLKTLNRLECLTMNESSPFAAHRASEVGILPQTQKEQISSGHRLLTDLYQDLITSTQYDRWAIWYMVIVDDTQIYVGFYPLFKDRNASDNRPVSDDWPVWKFEKDADGRSMFWPLMKQYLAYKYYSETPLKNNQTEKELAESVRKQVHAELDAIRALRPNGQ